MPYLRDAEEELGRASEITTQGLQFHRQSSYPAAANVILIMQSVLALFKEKFRIGRVEVRVANTRCTGTACASLESCAQVFANLIGNAIGIHGKWRPDNDSGQARHRLANRASRCSHHDRRYRFRHEPGNPESYVRRLLYHQGFRRLWSWPVGHLQDRAQASGSYPCPQ